MCRLQVYATLLAGHDKDGAFAFALVPLSLPKKRSASRSLESTLFHFHNRRGRACSFSSRPFRLAAIFVNLNNFPDQLAFFRRIPGREIELGRFAGWDRTDQDHSDEFAGAVLFLLDFPLRFWFESRD